MHFFAKKQLNRKLLKNTYLEHDHSVIYIDLKI